jgi:hypothetical protein
MSERRLSPRDALRAMVAGAGGASVRAAAQKLYALGGRAILPLTAQRALRAAVEVHAGNLLGGAGGAAERALAVARTLKQPAARTTATRVVAVHATRGLAARAAARQVFRGIGGAAGVGAVIDGVWGAAVATYRVRNGSMTHGAAWAHVAKEAGTGAISTAIGVTAAAAVVGATGVLAVPAVFVVGAATSIAAKIALTRWIDARTIGVLPAERVTVAIPIASATIA